MEPKPIFEWIGFMLHPEFRYKITGYCAAYNPRMYNIVVFVFYFPDLTLFKAGESGYFGNDRETLIPATKAPSRVSETVGRLWCGSLPGGLRGVRARSSPVLSNSWPWRQRRGFAGDGASRSENTVSWRNESQLSDESYFCHPSQTTGVSASVPTYHNVFTGHSLTLNFTSHSVWLLRQEDVLRGI